MGKLVDVAALLVVVAGIMVMVRPGSQGPALVNAGKDLFVGSLTTATGSGVPYGYTPTPWAQVG